MSLRKLNKKKYCISFSVHIGSSLRRTIYPTVNVDLTTWFPYTSSIHNTLSSSYVNVLTGTVTLCTRWTVVSMLGPTWWACYGNGGESFVMQPFYSTTSLYGRVGVYICSLSHYTMSTFPHMSTLGPQSQRWQRCLAMSNMRVGDKASWCRERLSEENTSSQNFWLRINSN